MSPIRVTERDVVIVRHVFEHRFLKSSHIFQLVQGGRQGILRRLQRLYHHGYLERPKAQIDYFHQGGSRPMVYGIGNRGAKLLEENSSIPKRKINWTSQNRSATRIFLQHTLVVADCMIALEVACRNSPEIKFIRLDNISKWNVSFSHNRKTTSLNLIPDKIFGLNRAGECFYFFLEADRGTMPIARRNLSQTSFQRKLLAYEATWKQNLHRSILNFHRFRVLTVTNSIGRAKNLSEAARTISHGTGLFLFTDLNSILSNDIFLIDWQTVVPEKTDRLI